MSELKLEKVNSDNVFTDLHRSVLIVLKNLAENNILPTNANFSKVIIETPKDPLHGHMSTNAALILAKSAGMSPSQLGEIIKEKLQEVFSDILEINVTKNGFINWTLNNNYWYSHFYKILEKDIKYGDSNIGNNQNINIEYVSANPTGPMHVGHARGAIFGDVLSNLLEKTGYNVCREYYINDAGNQVNVLAESVYIRYCEALGETINEIPEGLYPGEYLKEVGEALSIKYGNKYIKSDKSEWLEPIRDFAIESMMNLIKKDLEALGITHDVFSSEKELHTTGAINRVQEVLKNKDLLYVGTREAPLGKVLEDYESRSQLLFRSTQYGDDQDRPIQKSDGSWTYFASDIAYHLDKFLRGYTKMIDILGADHSGYVKRMTSAVTAITDSKGTLDVKLCQLVNLYENGVPLRMSKRSGTFITLREVVDEVGKDTVRFMMLTRRNDQTIDFDFKKVVEQSRDNMVWYVQYAHARACSILRTAEKEGFVFDINSNLSKLTDISELAIIRLLVSWPKIVETAAEAQEPHQIAFFLNEVATKFHSFYHKGNEDKSLKFIQEDNIELTLARLALVKAVKIIIASGLTIFGVTPLEEMY